jgi:hypothetical protein
LDLPLHQGADPSIVTDSGWNILHYAVFFEVFQGKYLTFYLFIDLPLVKLNKHYYNKSIASEYLVSISFGIG